MPTIDMQATGKNIVNMRKARGITVKDIQDAFGFNTPNAVYKWQTGKAMPTIDNMIVLADMFQAKIDDILVINRI